LRLSSTDKFMSPTTRQAQFKAIYEEYKNLVFNLSLQYVQQAEDAQDITQEVFVKVFQHLDKYNSNVASMKTWIYRITINQSLDFLKAKRRKKRFGFITSLFQGGEAHPSIMHFEHPGIALEDKEELRQLFEMINRLPDNQKTALILSRIEDRSQKEIAEIMNLGVKAVESLLQRAKNNLSKMLKGSEGFLG
ncbi:MAG: RNA polymerase sigma factor, partial [Chitinophagaceae bacterium]